MPAGNIIVILRDRQTGDVMGEYHTPEGRAPLTRAELRDTCLHPRKIETFVETCLPQWTWLDLVTRGV